MIKRIVLWNVKGNDADEIQTNAARIKELLESIKGKIPGMLDLEVGINLKKSTDACDIAFITIFDTYTSLENYNTHPEHEKIKSAVLQLRTDRHVVVFEYV